ncbi:hypothetical protein C0991_010626 [Blastosporella zonata]|nr:hypothetical protein C0991_010626 [Blastosporella zonata]
MTTYYWFSPYFLMLPQIEMHVNIQYGIRGDTRPVLFSNERQAFVFAILGSNNYFFFDGPSSLLYRVKDVQSDRQLVELLAKGDEAFAAKLEVVQENQQGKALISRILSRDESVIPILAQKFLDYTPTPTTPWMEMDTFEVSPEMEAEYDEISKQNLIEQEHALRFDEALEDGDEIRLDKELQDVEKEIEELQDFVNSISGLKKVDKQQLGELAQRKEQILEKWERRGAVPDEHDETDGEVPDAQLENHTEEAENLKVEIDVPPKMVKGMKVKYLTLTKNIDELLEEMEHINVPSNHEVFADYVDNYRLLRRAMSRLELRSALEVGDYLAHKLTEFKTNPEVITRLKKLTNGACLYHQL